MITPYAKQLLAGRVSSVLQPDPNAKGPYQVTSVYFDDHQDSAYHDKVEGIHDREKFRIRFYDNEFKNMRFECKTKRGDLSLKETATLTLHQWEEMLQGRYDFAWDLQEPVWQKFNGFTRTRVMRPVAVVGFLREAYVYDAGNVRITFDSNLAASNSLIREGEGHAILSATILELKFDDFLPSVVSDILSGMSLSRQAISKYCIAREHLWEVQQHDFRTTGFNTAGITD